MALFLNGKKLSGEPHNYSTEEQVVGTWIDGSTLYEKTIVISSLPSTTDPVEYTISSDTISLRSGEVYVEFPSGNKVKLPYINPYADFAYMKDNAILYQLQATGKLYIKCGKDSSTLSAIATVQYTKSST